MTAMTRTTSFAFSANERFKLQYPKTLRWATLVAVLATLAAALLSPRYEAHPYVLRHTEIIVLPPLDEPVDVEEKIVPPPAPVIPPNLEVVENEVDADPFDPSEWPDIDTPITPPAPPPGDFGFVPSSANPQLLHFVKPDYPALARQAQLEGTVLVKVLVGPDGKVVDAVVIKGAHPLLERAALAAARRCVFKPARQREIPVKAWIALPYNFRLH